MHRKLGAAVLAALATMLLSTSAYSGRVPIKGGAVQPSYS